MKNSVALTLTVSRASTPLSLEVAGVYGVVAFGEGDVTWRRTIVQGKYQRGRALLQAQQDTATDVLVLRVYGTSWVQVNNRVKTVRDAFSQFEYTTTLTVDGLVRIADCEPADITVTGDDSRRKSLMLGDAKLGHMRELQISIPRDPKLIEGAI